MVLLTITPAIVQALEKLQRHQSSTSSPAVEAQLEASGVGAPEPSLSEPSVDKPISHSQIIGISKQIKALGLSPYHLETFLQGSKVYNPPPPPKPKPTPEYEALMSRLRRDEEARTYDRLTNPPPPGESLTSRSPTTSAAHAFSSTSAYAPLDLPSSASAQADELTYADVSRQLTLILNVLVSIVCCAAALWWVGKWWSTPARLALSMSGSLVVAIAEVVVYSGYIRRVGEAKQKEGAVREVREVVRTWVIGREGNEDNLDGNKEGKEYEAVAVGNEEMEKVLRERKRREGDR